MNCPRCGKWLGIRRIFKAVPGRPFPCRACGKLLKIGIKESAKVAGIAIVAGGVALYFVPPPFGLLCFLALGAGVFYAYARLARPFDPAEKLSFQAGSGLFELLTEGIRYRSETHPYSAIPHLERYARRTSLHFIPVSDYLRIRVHLQGGAQPITLENKAGLLFTTAGLQEVYERLAERTFRHRLGGYLLQLERHGYFEYGGARLHRKGEIEIGDAKLDVRTAKFTLGAFELVIDPPGMFNRKRKIATETDQDVLLALLKQMYGIAFKS